MPLAVEAPSGALIPTSAISVKDTHTEEKLSTCKEERSPAVLSDGHMTLNQTEAHSSCSHSCLDA